LFVKDEPMASAILRYGCLLALLLAPAGASALVGDPAAFRTGIGAADDSLSPRRAHYWRGHILFPDYQKHCPYGKRWQPFPTDHGYCYACVPWR
jgi:hypothetical protein